MANESAVERNTSCRRLMVVEDEDEDQVQVVIICGIGE